jgi:hypothetical protein
MNVLQKRPAAGYLLASGCELLLLSALFARFVFMTASFRGACEIAAAASQGECAVSYSLNGVAKIRSLFVLFCLLFLLFFENTSFTEQESLSFRIVHRTKPPSHFARPVLSNST